LSGDSVHIADPRFDEWPVVRDFEDKHTAAAFRQQLEEAGITAVLTADWELDRFGRGEIALRVPGENYGDAEVMLSGLDL
jgi:sporulation-control protein spo0M